MLLWYSDGLVAGGVHIEKMRVAAALADFVSSDRSGIPFSDGLETNLIQYGVVDSRFFLASSGPHATHVSWLDSGDSVRANPGGTIKPVRLIDAIDALCGDTVDILIKPSGMTIRADNDTFFAKSLSLFQDPGFTAWEEFRRVIRGLGSTAIGVSAGSLRPLLQAASNRLRYFEVSFAEHIGIGPGGSESARGSALAHPVDMPFCVHGPTLLGILEHLPTATIRVMDGLPVLCIERGPHQVYLRGRPVEKRPERSFFPMPVVDDQFPVREGRLLKAGVTLSGWSTTVSGPDVRVIRPPVVDWRKRHTFIGDAAALVLDCLSGHDYGDLQIQEAEFQDNEPRIDPITICDLPLERFLVTAMFIGRLSGRLVLSHRGGKMVVSDEADGVQASCETVPSKPFDAISVSVESVRWIYRTLITGCSASVGLSRHHLVLDIFDDTRIALDAEPIDLPVLPNGERPNFSAGMSVSKARARIKNVSKKARLGGCRGDILDVAFIHDTLKDLAYLSFTTPQPARNSCRIPVTHHTGNLKNPVAVRENAVTLALGAIQGRPRQASHVRFFADCVSILRHVNDWTIDIRIR